MDFNTEWAAMKADFARLEAEQEAAAYTAEMERDDAVARSEARARAHFAERRLHTDSWSLRVMREAKAVRDADGDLIPELDAYLADCEAAAREVGVTPAAREQAAAEAQEAADAPTPGRGGNVATGTGSANGPSEKQLAFLASLCRELGYVLGEDMPMPRDKRRASELIDQAKRAVDALRRSGATPAAATARPATERQVEFLADLLNERVNDKPEDFDPATLSAKDASALIEELMRAPRAAKAAHGIREGYYAYSTDGGQTADHYHVRRSGQIVVWTAGGEHPYRGKLNEGLEWIKAHPREAAEQFGRMIGTCGRCGRVLSDDDSRERGLGPVCAGKSDW